jgi:hypothetical protein
VSLFYLKVIDYLCFLGLVRFMDNWPWKINVYGQKFFLLFHGHFPRHMENYPWTIDVHCQLSTKLNLFEKEILNFLTKYSEKLKN